MTIFLPSAFIRLKVVTDTFRLSLASEGLKSTPILSNIESFLGLPSLDCAGCQIQTPSAADNREASFHSARSIRQGRDGPDNVVDNRDRSCTRSSRERIEIYRDYFLSIPRKSFCPIAILKRTQDHLCLSNAPRVGPSS